MGKRISNKRGRKKERKGGAFGKNGRSAAKAGVASAVLVLFIKKAATRRLEGGAYSACPQMARVW